jgi:conjugal transfer mating pair stabilization protein TraG
VSDSSGLSQSQVASIAFGAAAHLGLSTPSIGPVSAGASLKADAGKSYQTGLSADQRKVLGAMTSEQIAEFRQFGDRVSRDASFSNVVGSDSREARELASRLATTASRSERAEASLSARTALAERLSSAREHGEVLSIDIAQDPHNLEMFMRYADRYGGNSAAAAAMFDAEVARQGLRPTRTFSDGSALPTSFEDLHRRHEQGSQEPAFNPDITGADREHGRRVARFGNTVPGAKASPSASPLRSEVQAQAAGIRQQAEAARGSFDAGAEIVHAPDGTLASKKSLLKQTAKQVGSDAGASVDAAKDAVKDLLKKKQ